MIKFKIGPVNIYITRHRMKRRTKKDDERRNRRRKQNIIKRQLYRKNGGQCDICKKRLPLENLQAHHIIGVAENKNLIAKKSNIRLLCHECHMKIHAHGRKEAAL